MFSARRARGPTLATVFHVGAQPLSAIVPPPCALRCVFELVIDDSKTIRRTAETLLAKEGCDIAFCDISEPLKSTLYRTATTEDRIETEKLVSETGRRCLAVEADVRDRPAMQVRPARPFSSRFDIT